METYEKKERETAANITSKFYEALTSDGGSVHQHPQTLFDFINSNMTLTDLAIKIAEMNRQKKTLDAWRDED